MFLRSTWAVRMLVALAAFALFSTGCTDFDLGGASDGLAQPDSTDVAGRSGEKSKGDKDSTSKDKPAKDKSSNDKPPTNKGTAPGKARDCAAAGAGKGATKRGPTTISSGGTTTISNVIFDGNHSDDLVRVNRGHVVFVNVTFRGHGTGGTGHSLEVKDGGSVEVRNARFEGDPSEDALQFQYNKPSTVTCSEFVTNPGEDHVDTKDGASVTITASRFDVVPSNGQTIQNHNGSGPVNLIGNAGMNRVFYEDGASGEIMNSEIGERLWLYDTNNVVVAGSSIKKVKHGEGGGRRTPRGTRFQGNTIGSFEHNGGSCTGDAHC